jgi:hypothetical protein
VLYRIKILRFGDIQKWHLERMCPQFMQRLLKQQGGPTPLPIWPENKLGFILYKNIQKKKKVKNYPSASGDFTSYLTN